MANGYLTIFVIFLLAVKTLAQSGNYQSGARAMGMGQASVTLQDEWSAFNNIGGISGVKSLSTSFAYTNHYGIEGFNTMSATVAVPFQYGVTAISAYHFGDDLFNEQKLALGFGNSIGFVRLGAQINYLQYNIEGFGRKGVFVAEFGGTAEIIPQLVFGAYIFNINQVKLIRDQNERVPVLMRTGVSFKPVDYLMVNAEVSKDIDFDPIFKAGLEYILKKHFYFRAGVKTLPATHYFGLGIHMERIQFDYAFSTTYGLGFVHQASVDYHIKIKR